MPVNYRDAMLRHQLMLERVKGFYYLDFNKALIKVEREIRRILRNAPENMGELSAAKRRSLIAEIKTVQNDIMRDWVIKFVSANRELMDVDRVLASKIMEATQIEGIRKLTAGGLLQRSGRADELWKEILAEPIGANGQTLQEMLDDFVTSSSNKVILSVAKSAVNEVERSEAIAAIVGPRNKNEGLFRLIRANSRAVIATVMQHTSTTAHRKVQSASYETYRWVSVLDSKTTEICRGRHNKVFPYSTGPKPPAHFHCRSTIAPNVAGSEDDNLSDGDEWLARQLASNVTAMLGVSVGGQRIANVMNNAHTRPISIAKFGASADLMTSPK